MSVRRPRLGRTPAPGQGGSAGKAREKGESCLGGPVTSRKPAGAGHSGTPLRMALSLVLGLSLNPERVRLLAQSPRCLLRPQGHLDLARPAAGWVHTGPPWIARPSCRRAEGTSFQGPARSLSWVLPPPPHRIHQEAEQRHWAGVGSPQQTCRHPSWRDRRLASNAQFPFLSACRESSPTSKGKKMTPFKMWLFRRIASGLTCPPDQSAVFRAGARGRAGQAMLGGSRLRAWQIDSPRPHHPASGSEAPGGLWSSPQSPPWDPCFLPAASDTEGGTGCSYSRLPLGAASPWRLHCPVGHPGQGPLCSRLGDTRGQGKLESGLMGLLFFPPN